jgi:putative methionine-R-sulfoxide reductase with GAF domain
MNETRPSISFLQAALEFLFKPSKTVTDVGDRRKAELISWISLLLAFWFLLAALSIFAVGNQSNTTIVVIVLVATSLGTYFLSRTRLYAIAAWILVVTFSAGGFAIMVARPSIETRSTLLEIIILAFVIASAVLPVRDMFIVVIINSAVYFILPIFIPALNQIRFYTTATSAVIIGILLVVFSRLRNSVENERLEELRAANQQLHAMRNNLEQTVNERTAAAEHARADAETARRIAESQMWFTRGQAELAEKMRGDLEIPTLANNVTSFLCQYLGARTGALYLVSSDLLKLTGQFAYTDSGSRNEFHIGEGLVGETARSNQSIRVADLPLDALMISSALGEAKPNQLLIAPIAVDGRVLGVVELATLSAFSADHEAFLGLVSESIAIAFRTAQARIQIRELLSQSQLQAEELQAQEEELRTANEELQAKADRLK